MKCDNCKKEYHEYELYHDSGEMHCKNCINEPECTEPCPHCDARITIN